MRTFFLTTPCRSLRRELLALADPDGNIIVVSIAWVRLRGHEDAGRFLHLIDVHGSGDIRPIGSAALQFADVAFTARHYGSRRAGSLVVLAEAEPATGNPDAQLLDGIAQVAAWLPRR